MKVTGIGLIQKIDRDEIKKLQKVNVLSPNGEIYSKCYYEDGDLLTIDTNEDLMDIIKLGGLNYYHYEIIEEPKEELEEIEKLKKISYQIVGVYDNDINRIVKDFNKQIRQIGENINANVKIANDILVSQNKIVRELKDNEDI